MNKKARYTAGKALAKIWKLGSDWEFDDLDDTNDDDDEIVPNPRIGDVDESDDVIDLQTEEAGEVENSETEEVEISKIEASEGNIEQEEEEDAQTLIAKFEKHQPRWR